jgi:ribonuclease P protein component
MPAQPRHTFRKHEHLCGELRIKEVATTGKAVHVPPFRLVGKFMELPGTAPAQIAFAVPRRNLRKAVERNRMKRLMREAYRLMKPRTYERLSAGTGRVAWLLVYQGRELIGQEETARKISDALDRWLLQHG